MKAKLNPGPKLIVSRTAEQATQVIKKHKLEDARYVFDFRTVLAYDRAGAQVIFACDYLERRDWDELHRLLGVRDLLRTAVTLNL